jgi:hypothetical protein
MNKHKHHIIPRYKCKELGIDMSEAFVYLWYDAPNKKYYLGKHKGSPKDTYTHSSRIWESFTKDTIPKGVTRRILAYGTDEEMCILENKLLINRKKRCWNRYYNESLGDPRYVDQWGENNSQWKGGITYDQKVYNKSPERKAYIKAYSQEYRVNHPKYYQTPKWIEYHKEYRIKKRDEKRIKDREYYAKKKLERQDWVRGPYKKKYDAERRARKKLEKQQGVATLEKFL